MGTEDAIGGMIGTGMVAVTGVAVMNTVARSMNGGYRRRTTRRRTRRSRKRSGF
jgi:uncharacterized BrkB/YihY/UPF0761 family membrane protein